MASFSSKDFHVFFHLLIVFIKFHNTSTNLTARAILFLLYLFLMLHSLDSQLKLMIPQSKKALSLISVLSFLTRLKFSKPKFTIVSFGNYIQDKNQTLFLACLSVCIFPYNFDLVNF